MKLTLADVERCLTGSSDIQPGDDREVNTVRIDNRAVQRGDVFICIEGERFDAHEFAPDACQAGAAMIVAARPLEVDVPAIVVRDTRKALGKLAACWRNLCQARLCCITGSAGKTTVKEMFALACTGTHKVAKNHRNLNNQIGLPMSMLQATPEQDLWIMEAGISEPGDMEDLAAIAQPDIAIITNVGPAHLQGLGTVEEVAFHKSVLLRYLRQDGTAIVSRDYPELWAEAMAVQPDITGFSIRDDSADFFAQLIAADNGCDGRFRLKTPDGDGEVVLPFCGDHFAENLAAVAAAAYQLGIHRDTVVERLKQYTPDPQRFCPIEKDNLTVIDDTYNANPISMQKAIRAARSLACDRPLVLVLADMRELGAHAHDFHMALGKDINDARPVAAFYNGDFFADVQRVYNGELQPAKTPEEFMAGWKKLTREHDLDKAVVLFKGSRSMAMEHFAQALKNEPASKGAAE